MTTKKHIILKLIARIALHILFWLIVLLFFTYFFGFGSDIEGFGFSFALFVLPITIAITYVSIYNLIPNFLLKKHYKKFVLYAIYTLIISAYLIAISIFYGLIYLSEARFSNMSITSKNFIFILVGVYLVVLMVSVFKLLRLQVKATEKSSALEQKILATQLKLKEQELQYLKMQIQPHFLFNTLNTMYGFALKKADETPEMILKLSNLLDYLLYQVDKPFVALSEEIKHLEDYLELEKMRFNDTLLVNFEKEMDNPDLKVAPMLFLPFIENSFKHGNIINGKLTIHIHLKTEKDSIYFSVENSTNDNAKTVGGIGLNNLKKRLDLLYKNKHDLQIEQFDNTFKINLTLRAKK